MWGWVKYYLKMAWPKDRWEVIGWIFCIGVTCYYTYYAGWKGFVLAVLAIIFMSMVIYYFGWTFPIIGRYIYAPGEKPGDNDGGPPKLH